MSDFPLKECASCKRSYNSVEDFMTNTSRWRVCESGHLWFNCSCQSTGIIVKGKFPWYSPTTRLGVRARSFFNELAELKNLPHLPTVVLELQQLIEKPGVDSAQIASVMKRNPLIAGNVIRMANDLKRAGASHQISSLEHAVAYLGMDTLEELVLAAGVQSFSFPTQKFNHQAFWERSFLVGRISEGLAKRFAPHLNPDEIYIAGCLANLGKVAMAICFPTDCDRVAKEVENPKKLPTWQVAEQNLGVYDHTILGEIAAAMWGMPDAVMEATAHHHRPGQQSSFKESTHIVSLANQLSHWVMLTPSRIDQPLLAAVSRGFQLTDGDLEIIAREYFAAA